MDKAIWKIIEGLVISRRQLVQVNNYRKKKVSRFTMRLLYDDPYIDKMLEHFIEYSDEQIAGMIHTLDLKLDQLLDSQIIETPL